MISFQSSRNSERHDKIESSTIKLFKNVQLFGEQIKFGSTVYALD